MMVMMMTTLTPSLICTKLFKSRVLDSETLSILNSSGKVSKISSLQEKV